MLKVLSNAGQYSKLDFEDDSMPGVGGTYTVTNMQEVKAQTHLLKAGDRVMVFMPWNSKRKIFLFCNERVSTRVRFKIMSAAAGGAIYNIRIYQPNTADVDPTATLTEAMLGTLPTADDGIGRNMQEIGQNTHDLLDPGNTFQFDFWGEIVHVNPDGKKVVDFNGVYLCDAGA
jgi:hypothetical protein